MMRVGLLLVMLFAAVVPAAAASVSGAAGVPKELPPKLEARYQKLTSELRCPVCQNEPIATSQAQISSALRKIVRQKLLAGDSNQQIKQYMISRYGLFALYKPPVQRSTWLLWFGPLILFLVGMTVAGRAMYRRHRLLGQSDAE